MDRLFIRRAARKLDSSSDGRSGGFLRLPPAACRLSPISMDG
jgi:hypothetical protein